MTDMIKSPSGTIVGIPSRANDGQIDYRVIGLEYRDPRASLLVDLVRIWGQASAMSEALGQLACEEHRKEIPPLSDLIAKCAEAVDMIYDESQRRGWILNIPDPTK